MLETGTLDSTSTQVTGACASVRSCTAAHTTRSFTVTIQAAGSGRWGWSGLKKASRSVGDDGSVCASEQRRRCSGTRVRS